MPNVRGVRGNQQGLKELGGGGGAPVKDNDSEGGGKELTRSKRMDGWMDESGRIKGLLISRPAGKCAEVGCWAPRWNRAEVWMRCRVKPTSQGFPTNGGPLQLVNTRLRHVISGVADQCAALPTTVLELISVICDV